MTLSSFGGILALLLLGSILWFLWKLVRSPLPLEMQEVLEKKHDEKLGLLKKEWSERLSEEMKKIWDQVQGQVQTTEQSVSGKLQQANDTFAKVTLELGRLQEATKNVEAVGRNVASLEDLLRAPKMRGGLGEFFLADLIAQIIPSAYYTLQYEFSDGEKVDAVIRLHEKLVPVDSKFPLENFRKMSQAVTEAEKAQWRKLFLKDVRQHVDTIAQKYIRPVEGTFDFALMYIPAENVYYETIIKDDAVDDDRGLFQHAIQKQVIPVSPNSFYAYLQVISLGLRGMAIERGAQEILANLKKLQKDLMAVRSDFDTAGSQLRNAVKNFEKAERHLGRFEDRLEVIEAPSEGTDLLPETESEPTRSLEKLPESL